MYLRGEGALPDVVTLENSIRPEKHKNIIYGYWTAQCLHSNVWEACIWECEFLTKVQHVHVIVADGSVPSAKHIDLPLLHHTCRMSGRETLTEGKPRWKPSHEMCLCLNQTIVPWTGGGRTPCYNGLVPDRDVGVEDVQRVTAAIRLWVRTRKHSSQHKEFTPKHAAAVVGQRRNLPLGLEEKSGKNVKKDYRLY